MAALAFTNPRIIALADMVEHVALSDYFKNKNLVLLVVQSAMHRLLLVVLVAVGLSSGATEERYVCVIGFENNRVCVSAYTLLLF